MRFLRYAFLLFTIALIGPGAAAVLATNASVAGQSVRKAGAPADDFTVSGIEFSLERGDNARPVAPSNRFRFGARQIWAFWAWNDADNDQPVHWILRFAGTDVAFGDIETDDRDGRMELMLERADGDYLMIGTFHLILEPRGRNAGPTREATFEIYDDDDDSGNDNGDGDNGNDNSSNDNSNNDNGDGGDNGNDNGDGNDNGG